MISVIIPYTDGDSTRKRAFYGLMADVFSQTHMDYEVILVEELFEKHSKVPFKFNNHIILRYEKPFNKSWCINVGVRQAKSNNCVILDADMQLPEDYLEMFDQFPKNKFCVGYRDILLQVGRDNPEPRKKNYKEVKTAGGAWYVDKEFFWSIGGMNESYFGYGAEDNDFYMRAKHILGVIHCLPVDLTHSYHHWHPKESNFPLNPDRVGIYNKMMKDLNQTIRLLKSKKLGDPKQPRSILNDF